MFIQFSLPEQLAPKLENETASDANATIKQHNLPRALYDFVGVIIIKIPITTPTIILINCL